MVIRKLRKWLDLLVHLILPSATRRFFILASLNNKISFAEMYAPLLHQNQYRFKLRQADAICSSGQTKSPIRKLTETQCLVDFAV
jgi:hypothetical protein